MKSHPEFWKILLDSGSLTGLEAESLHREVEGDGFEGLRRLVKDRPHDKNKYCRLWGDSIGFGTVELDKTLFAADLVPRLPKELAIRHCVIPLYEFAGTVTVACADPTDLAVRQIVSAQFRQPVSPVFAWPDDILASIEVHYQSEEEVQERLRKILEIPFLRDAQAITLEQLQRSSGDQAVIEFAHAVLLLAAKNRASDIHLEPGESKVRIRYRVDGVLKEIASMSPGVHLALVSRLKVMASLDIIEKRKPQDGRLSLELPGRTLDFRFSSVPTIYGEKIVLRILGQLSKVAIPSLDNIALSSRQRKAMGRVLKQPNGVFLLTGPTGSGKTTTLYAMLKELNQDGVNIMTIEDPVEYRLAGINQIQVNAQVDLTFANALRSFLRQDPDVILVGEIRDHDTARIALQAALTGHLVLSTLHANSAIHAVTRLLDFGIEPYLVGPALIGTMGQRLVRRICDKCRESYVPSRETMDELFEGDARFETRLFRGKGCSVCGSTGYLGRITIHETFLLDEEVREAISRGMPGVEIQALARRAGYANLRWDGMKKVLRGLTTLEELDRVALED